MYHGCTQTGADFHFLMGIFVGVGLSILASSLVISIIRYRLINRR